MPLEVLSDDELQQMEASGGRWWEQLVLVRRTDFERMMSELRALRAWRASVQEEREELARLRAALDVYGDMENWWPGWDEYNRYIENVRWWGENGDDVAPGTIARRARGRQEVEVEERRVRSVTLTQEMRQRKFDDDYAALVATCPPEEFDAASRALEEECDANR